MQLPKLSDDDKENSKTELTIAKCCQILKTFNFGKSPGEDGFTVQFYTKFFELLASDLVESLNTAYSRGELSISQRRGVVTLIPKADSDTEAHKLAANNLVLTRFALKGKQVIWANWVI